MPCELARLAGNIRATSRQALALQQRTATSNRL